MSTTDGTNTWFSGKSFDFVTELEHPQISTFALNLQILDDWETTTIPDIEMKMTTHEIATYSLQPS
eukprot:1060701-Ditylum_brightwellii.AAC.1